MDSPSGRSPWWSPGGCGKWVGDLVFPGRVAPGRVAPGRIATGRDLREDGLRNLARGNTKGQG